MLKKNANKKSIWSIFSKEKTIKKPKKTIRPSVEKRVFSPSSYIFLPDKKEGVPIGYKYMVRFKLTNEAAFLESAKNKEWKLDAMCCGSEVHLFSCGTDIGILLDRKEMMMDWISRGDPYEMVIDKVDLDGDSRARLVFYKDKRLSYANLEQDVIKLTSYKSKRKQEIISFLYEATEIDLEECEESVIASYEGDEIGKLPKAIASKYINKYATAAFVEKIEIDESEDEPIYIPYIRIFW